MKNILITGASRGLGRAIAVRLAEGGNHILINYRSGAEAAEETKRMVEAAGGTAELMPFDVSDPAAIEAALDAWQTAHDGEYIAVLVNNAGIRKDNLMVFMQDADWHSVIDTTMNGFFYTTRLLLKQMMVKRWGRVINIASLSGLKGLPGQTNYSAAKGALIGATKALAQEVAARKVTVNAVAPGFIETDMTAELDMNELKKLVPAGRFGKPEEVAALVAFLASDDAAYITGQAISINGGLYS